MVDRRYMLQSIKAEARNAASWVGSGDISRKVLDAIANVPREEFVPPSLVKSAYENSPLPIGYDQTISQPYIVALMTDLIRPEPEDVILEVGTGSGYQAAVLSSLVSKIYSLEIVPELAQQAKERLSRLGYHNVEVHHSDGHYGLPEHAPYDGIIVTAAARSVPEALIEQLHPDGRLVIPVGGGYFGQELLVIYRNKSGELVRDSVLPVAFVPLTGGEK